MVEQSLWREIQRGHIAPLYFLYGVETYLIEQTCQLLRQALITEENQSWNLVILDLEEVPVQDLVQEAETPSFFGDRRLIIGKNANFLTTSKGRDAVSHDVERLQQYLEQPLTDNVVVLTVASEKVDKRKKIVKLLEKQAKTVKFDPLTGKQLAEWLLERSKELGFRMEKQALIRLLELVGPDLNLLDQECRKLVVYAGKGGTVTAEMVEMLVPRTLEQDVFKLTENIAQRNLAKAFQIWEDLLFQKEEPIRILALLIRQFRLLLQVKSLAERGLGEKEIASELGVHPYPVKLAMRQINSFSESHLRQLLLLAIETDQAIKAGKVDKTLGVERLLFRVGAS